MDTVKIELEVPRVLVEHADINSESYGSGGTLEYCKSAPW
jgi:hypothetical protein